MNAEREQSTNNSGGRPLDPLNKNLSDGGDLQDSPHDLERMQSEEIIMDLPEVKDIPGQEHVVPPVFGEFSDTTISSDDEEGVSVFGDEDDEETDTDFIMGTDADTTPEERKVLETADLDMQTDDDTNLRRAELDDTDMEGDPLNETALSSNQSGSDLDTSGVDADDAMEAIGEEDEENNLYSLGSADNDPVTEGTP
ncbi:hypothetical protein EXU57_21610 [Segetibacter sp. 3557_3]|uniref:hypothetical protein n=1 Tax=Segetibacter sp. 3557_3 TaxID=2547429 RepID=UPI00105841A3|nr:hypothetical protein [Segetibacter sp. 3557_3]TDH20033.1 hypothetical protein EXU57_21610 [Segetibacter sp. 3557_3]